MRFLHFFTVRPLYVAILLFLAFAVILGTLVAVYWRAEYLQCLAVRGGFSDILAGTCQAEP